jgi:hypothetical protein
LVRELKKEESTNNPKKALKICNEISMVSQDIATTTKGDITPNFAVTDKIDALDINQHTM